MTRVARRCQSAGGGRWRIRSMRGGPTNRCARTEEEKGAGRELLRNRLKSHRHENRGSSKEKQLTMSKCTRDGREGGAGWISLHSHGGTKPRTRGEGSKAQASSRAVAKIEPPRRSSARKAATGGDGRAMRGVEGVSQRQGAAPWSAQVRGWGEWGRGHGQERFRRGTVGAP